MKNETTTKSSKSNITEPSTVKSNVTEIQIGNQTDVTDTISNNTKQTTETPVTAVENVTTIELNTTESDTNESDIASEVVIGLTWPETPRGMSFSSKYCNQGRNAMHLLKHLLI